MLLAVDVGNTQTHLGAFDGDGARRATGAWRPCRAPRPTSWPRRSRDLLELEGLELRARSTGRSSRPSSRSSAPSTRRSRERHIGQALPARRPHPEDRDADPGRQPARARRGPPGQRGRRTREGERGLRGGRLRHLDQLRRGLGCRRVPRRRDRAGGRDLDGGAHLAHREAPADRPLRPRGPDRQAHAGRDPGRLRLRVRRPRRRHRPAPRRGAGRAGDLHRHRRPRARRSRRTARRSTRSTRCSRCAAFA